jgi:hypothetical protein
MSPTNWPIVPTSPRILDEYGAVGGMRELAGETQVLGENLPQHDLTWDRTWAVVVGKLAANCLSYV